MRERERNIERQEGEIQRDKEGERRTNRERHNDKERGREMARAGEEERERGEGGREARSKRVWATILRCGVPMTVDRIGDVTFFAGRG
jgi:hypothetical protein